MAMTSIIILIHAVMANEQPIFVNYINGVVFWVVVKKISIKIYTLKSGQKIHHDNNKKLTSYT